eukprot:gene12936-14915_t
MDPQQQMQNPPLSSAQMESLQKLVKQFKELVSRYQKSCIPPLAEALIASAHPAGAQHNAHGGAAHAPSSTNAQGQNGLEVKPVVGAGYQAPDHHHAANTATSLSNSIPAAKGMTVKTVPVSSKQSENKDNQSAPSTMVAVTPRPPPAPPSHMFPPQQVTNNLSWQCFHSILFYGVGKAPNDGSVGFALSDVGCFSKGATLPLVMNKLSASCIREELIRFGLDHSLEYLSADEKDQNHLFALQRHLRGNTVGQFLIHQKREGVQIVPGLPVGTGNVLSELAHYANFARARKATQRQNRTIAIEER